MEKKKKKASMETFHYQKGSWRWRMKEKIRGKRCSPMDLLGLLSP